MLTFAKTQVMGYVGKDAEIKVVNGNTVMNFNLAATRKWTNGNGQTTEETTWVRVAVWGKNAENLAKLGVVKGLPVYVEGTLRPAHAYTDGQGKAAASIEINAQSVILLTGKDGGPSQSAPAEEEVDF